jgi:GxxExxY protein
VANTLGRGFVENIYANALAKEPKRQTIEVRREIPVKVHYKK